jgi:hypothetical protein
MTTEFLWWQSWETKGGWLHRELVALYGLPAVLITQSERERRLSGIEW